MYKQPPIGGPSSWARDIGASRKRSQVQRAQGFRKATASGRDYFASQVRVVPSRPVRIARDRWRSTRTRSAMATPPSVRRTWGGFGPNLLPWMRLHHGPANVTPEPPASLRRARRIEWPVRCRWVRVDGADQWPPADSRIVACSMRRGPRSVTGTIRIEAAGDREVLGADCVDVHAGSARAHPGDHRRQGVDVVLAARGAGTVPCSRVER